MAFYSSLFSALAIWPLIWWLSRKEGAVSLRPVLFICLGVTFATYFALRFFDIWGLGIVLPALIIAVSHWCYLSWSKSVLVAAAWLIFQIFFGTWIAPIF